MKPEQQRIAIAEACGWTDVKGTKGVHPKARFKGCGYADDWIALPDYLNDLNAMHEAMAHLEPEQVDQFAAELSGIVWWDLTSNEVGHVANATATQRAEAFLRTIGKWEESR